MKDAPRRAALALAAAGVGLLTSAAAAVSAGAVPQGQAQAPAFSARVEMVRLHAAVLDGDGPVSDLTAEDFVVIDNGIEYPVALALSPDETPIDVALVIDQSESIRLGAPTVKRDARAFLDALGAEDCAFVLPFQHRVGPGVWGPSLAPTLLQTIDLARIEGGTSMNDALIVGLSEVQRWNVPAVLGERVVVEYQQPIYDGGVGIDLEEIDTTTVAKAPEVAGFQAEDLPFRIFPSSFGCGGLFTAQTDRRKALVVLSDGVDTTSIHTFGELLGFVYETDVPVFPVELGHPGSQGPSVNADLRRAARTAEERLKTLAEATGGKFVRGSGSETRLREAYDEIVTILRGSYLLGYYPNQPNWSPAAVPDAGRSRRHEVEVKVRRGGVDVFARSEYFRSSSGGNTARTALRRGEELALAGEYEAAIVEAATASRERPEMWDAYFLQAAALWMGGRGGEALAPLSRVLEMAPGVPSAHFLAWQLQLDQGAATPAWSQLTLARIAGLDADAEVAMTGQRFSQPGTTNVLLAAPRILVEGPRGDDPADYERLAWVTRSAARAISSAPSFGLVRDPLAADYFLYIDAEDEDGERPGVLKARLELFNYADQRLWRGDLDIGDLSDLDEINAAVASAVAKLEAWLREGR